MGQRFVLADSQLSIFFDSVTVTRGCALLVV